MSNIVQHTEVSKLPRLQYSREFFADYLTAFLSRIRQDEKCDAVYIGRQKHPLIAVQLANTAQLQGLNIRFIDEATLNFTPFRPTENFVIDVNNKSTTDPKLHNGWDAFLAAYNDYKETQHKIYGIIVATLRVGTSMHYARAVPYGAGIRLLMVIRNANMQTTTRALFALFASLFTLKMKDGESFEVFRQRFDLITNRFANWRPPIILPQELLLYFVLRGLPDSPHGPTRHIILAQDNPTLMGGLRLLRDVGSSEVGLINNTLGSNGSFGVTQETNAILALMSPPNPTNQPTAAQKAREERRQKRMTKLCKELGPCANHGPKSLHATCECKDPKLTKRGKNKNKTPVNAVTPSPTTH